MADRAYVWVDPGRQGGRPCVGGTRIPTDQMADEVAAFGVGDVAGWYDLTRADLLVACWFEWRHADGRTRRGKWVRDAFPHLWKGNYDAVPDPPKESP